METLGQLLVALRGAEPPGAAARRLGVHRGTLWAWESDVKRPRPVHLARALARYEASTAQRLLAWELLGDRP